jgi:hypothetical protein
VLTTAAAIVIPAGRVAGTVVTPTVYLFTIEPEIGILDGGWLVNEAVIGKTVSLTVPEPQAVYDVPVLGSVQEYVAVTTIL